MKAIPLHKNGKMRDKMLTAQELADRWHCHTSTIWRYRKQGIIQSAGPGRKVLFRMSDVLAVEERKAAPFDGS